MPEYNIPQSYKIKPRPEGTRILYSIWRDGCLIMIDVPAQPNTMIDEWDTEMAAAVACNLFHMKTHEYQLEQQLAALMKRRKLDS